MIEIWNTIRDDTTAYDIPVPESKVSARIVLLPAFLDYQRCRSRKNVNIFWTK